MTAHPAPKPKVRRGAIARLFAEFLPYRRQVILVFCLGLVISAVQPAAVKVSQRIIDELQAGISGQFFRWVPVALIGIFLISGLAKYFYNTTRRILTERVLAKMRIRMFDRFLWMHQSQIDRSRSGELLARLQNDLSQISIGVETMCDLLKEPFTFLGLIGFAIYTDWRLAVLALVGAPLVAFLFSKCGSAVKRYTSRGLGQFSDLVSLAQESLSGSRIVKLFGLEKELSSRFSDVQAQYLKTVSKSVRVQELSTPSVELLGAILMAAVIVYGGYRGISAGQLVSFVIALGLAQAPLKQLNSALLRLKQAEAAAERVYGLLDDDETIERTETGLASVPLLGLKDRLEFKNVSLRYGEREALSDISFTVRKGETIALVGHSGSGKSSIVNLLARLYDIESGAILFDGRDVRDFDVHQVRKQIAFVSQDPFLFHASIRENIRFGRPDATESEILQAAEDARCTEFIDRCPQGLDTLVGDRGACLSGGERQRLAIARAILKHAPILILDEATSSLDSRSELLVRQALTRLSAEKTTFLIAHHFSGIVHADQIVVLGEGRILERGTHSELLRLSGTYSELFRPQTRLVDA